MRASRPEPETIIPARADLEWLMARGVPMQVLMAPRPIRLAHGLVGDDGLFEYDSGGDPWFAFEEPDDWVFWQTGRSRLVTYTGRAFALGEEAITNAGTYAFDCTLNIFANPLEWLLAKRDGIVVLDWRRAFDRLRDAPRIAIDETLLPTYRRFMKPARVPQLFVMAGERKAG
jgi:hypothetical protein